MINDRILQLIEIKCNGNKRAFAKQIGVPATSIDNVVGSRKSKPNFDLLERILSSFEDIDANWLMLGKEKEETESDEKNKIQRSLDPDLISKMLDEMKALNEKIADQAKAIGMLEAENKYIKKMSSPGNKESAEDAGCAAVG